MTANDKLQKEVKGLESEMELLKGAVTTSDACSAIAKYVSGEEGQDPLLTHAGDNPFLAAPSSAGGCCTVQ